MTTIKVLKIRINKFLDHYLIDLHHFNLINLINLTLCKFVVLNIRHSYQNQFIILSEP